MPFPSQKCPARHSRLKTLDNLYFTVLGHIASIAVHEESMEPTVDADSSCCARLLVTVC
jgi:hypothetical protein